MRWRKKYWILKMDNTLVCIGFLGDMICYLNITEEEAICRYKKDVGYDDYHIKIINFKDKFGVYSIDQIG